MKRFLTFRIVALAVLLTSCAPVISRLSKIACIIDGDTMEIADGIRIRYTGAGASEVCFRERVYCGEMSAADQALV